MHFWDKQINRINGKTLHSDVGLEKCTKFVVYVFLNPMTSEGKTKIVNPKVKEFFRVIF